MKAVHTLLLLLISFGAAGSLPGCGNDKNPSKSEPGYVYRIPKLVDGDWDVASLADAGIDPEPLVLFMKGLLEAGDHHFHCILIVKDGQLVFEEYFSGDDVELDEQVPNSGKLTYTYKDFDRNTLHFQGSAVKSFISAWVGIAIDKGFIAGTNQTLFSFFPEYSHLADGAKSNITIGQMLTMTSGLPWDDDSYPIYDPRNDEYQMVFNEDPIGYVLQTPLFALPGRIFEYNSGTTYLLGQIVKRSSGMSLTDFTEGYLFGPLGIQSSRWASSRHNEGEISTTGLYLRPRDMARFGQLYLQEGMWGESRIIPKDWVTDSTMEYVHFSGSELPFTTGYGYQWWLGSFSSGPTRTYIAAGWGGQLIFVLPEINMVVVLTGGDYELNNFVVPFSLVNDVILPAVK